MTSDLPLVSIGLPTYNGAPYIREALDSLLAQDYPNLEILVSDNASTDGTGEIVRGYAERDLRVRVVRQDRNIGAPANFNFVFRETRGPFFMWAADDDRWEPNYVSACLRALQAVPSAVSACTQIKFIDETGELKGLDLSLFDNPDLSSPSVKRRVRTLLSRGAWYQTYGLMRREALARTRLYRRGYGADVVLVLELVLRGPFVLVTDRLHVYRISETRTEPDRGAWHDSIPDRARIMRAPYTHMQEAFSDAIAVAALGRVDKLLAFLGMAEAAYLRPTPLRGWIAAESRTRLTTALRERRPRQVIKYATLGCAIGIYRRLHVWRRSLR